jgi:hypothetical protein
MKKALLSNGNKTTRAQLLGLALRFAQKCGVSV